MNGRISSRISTPTRLLRLSVGGGGASAPSSVRSSVPSPSDEMTISRRLAVRVASRSVASSRRELSRVALSS